MLSLNAPAYDTYRKQTDSQHLFREAFKTEVENGLKYGLEKSSIQVS